MNILLKWLVTSVSLLIISKLPTGVEIDSFQKAAISAIVFGILNVLLVPILKVLSLPMALIFSSFFLSLLMNMIIFGLAAIVKYLTSSTPGSAQIPHPFKQLKD